MTRAVLFDLDGTLVDSLEDIADAVEGVLAELGFPGHPLDAYRTFIGEGLPLLIRRALPEASRDDETVRDCIQRARVHYADHLVRKSRPYPGIPQLLDAIAARGIAMAVLSNKPDDFTRIVVETLFGSERFAIVRGALPDVPRKPDPGAALAIAEAVGVPAAAWRYLGDTIIDVQTAHAAGMTPIGVLWGFRPQELRDAAIDHLIAAPAELLPLL